MTILFSKWKRIAVENLRIFLFPVFFLFSCFPAVSLSEIKWTTSEVKHNFGGGGFWPLPRHCCSLPAPTTQKKKNTWKSCLRHCKKATSFFAKINVPFPSVINVLSLLKWAQILTVHRPLNTFCLKHYIIRRMIFLMMLLSWAVCVRSTPPLFYAYSRFGAHFNVLPPGTNGQRRLTSFTDFDIELCEENRLKLVP